MQNWSIWSKSRTGARRARTGIGIALATSTMTCVALAPIGALPAFAATGVSSVTAAVSPTTAGAGTATYTIGFDTSSSGSLAGGGTVTITAPDGTAFPSYVSGYKLTAAGSSVPVQSVTTTPAVGPGSTGTSATYNQAVITLGGSTSSTVVKSNETVSLVVYPAGNPIHASTAEHLDVSTSADTTQMPSGAYTITAGPAASFISPQGDNQRTPTSQAFAKQLGVTLVDAYGNPVQGTTVTFTAPASASGDSNASGTFDHSNSAACPTANPTSPPPSNVCSVVTGANGMATASTLTANNNSGGYTVTATYPGVPTENFSLTNCPGSCPAPPTQVSPGSATVSSTTAGATGVAYTISFTTTASGPASGGTITLVAPAGTGFSTHASDYSISVNHLHLASVNSVSATSTGGSASPNQVVITLGLSTIGAGDLVTVKISQASGGSGMSNPTKAGFNYQIEESTSADTLADAYTSTYSITPADPAAVSTDLGDNQTALIGNPFPGPLAAMVEDKYGNPVAGAQVTFTTPSTGPSAAWANTTNVETDTTTSTGQAESSVPVADSVAGGPYAVTAAANAVYKATQATFHLTNSAQPVNPSTPALSSTKAGESGVSYTLTFTTSSTGGLGSDGTISITAPSGTDFTSSNANDYSLTVSGGNSATVSQVTPSAAGTSTTPNHVVIVLGSSSIAPGDTVALNINGVTNPTAAGDAYTITESTSADSVAATTPAYSITAADPALISVVSGNNQSATEGQQFDSPLIVSVVDAYDNPVPGATITFSAPASGASASFAGGSTSENDITDSNGLATSTIPTANGSGGTYPISVTDAAFHLTANPTFSLTNLTAAQTNTGSESGTSAPSPCPTGVTHVASGEPWAVAAMSTWIDGQSCAGYWVVTRTGGVTAFGAAPWLGDMSGYALNAQMVGIAATPTGRGYYLLGADGGIFTFGDAVFHGSTGSKHLNAPVVAMAVTPTGDGYWLAASDGGVFTFGDALFFGSMGGKHLNQPVVGMSADAQTGGYWLVAADGGIFTFNAPFYGSTASKHLNQPVVGMTPQPDGHGYRLVAGDGGVFSFGDAAFYGSLPGRGIADPRVTTMASSVDGNGYYLINGAGTVWAFGDAPYLGAA